jgi:hypothetical protein
LYFDVSLASRFMLPGRRNDRRSRAYVSGSTVSLQTLVLRLAPWLTDKTRGEEQNPVI